MFYNSFSGIRLRLWGDFGIHGSMVGKFRALSFLLLLFLSVPPLAAQQGLQPKFEIPSSMAKVPQPEDFEGEWIRGDGTYRLEIDLTDDGVEARYFNPDPVNVGSAEFPEDSRPAEPELVVVLRDEGYPGSTYRLSYFSERMVLVGTYTRPGTNPAEIYFVRREDVLD